MNVKIFIKGIKDYADWADVGIGRERTEHGLRRFSGLAWIKTEADKAEQADLLDRVLF